MENKRHRSRFLEEARDRPHLCFAEATRAANRAVSKFYERHLKDVDIGIAQLSLLIRLYYLPDVPVTRLARVLKTDRTTLTRNLQPLERSGHLVVVGGEDRRARLVRLTPKGFASVEAALPAWQAAQRELEQKLGAARWTQMMEELRMLADLCDD